MKSINMKNAAFMVLWIVLIGWLLLAWAPMIRKDHETFDKTEEVLRNSKATIEKTRGLIEQIEKTTPRQIPQAPAEDGALL